MGESILDSLSLPPSGRLPSNQSTEANTSAGNLWPTRCAQTSGCTSFITPVIGLISNEDVPVMISASKKAASSKDAANKQMDPEENLKFTAVKEKQKGEREKQQQGEKNTNKRKHLEQSQSESDEESQVLSLSRSGKRRIIRHSQVSSKQTPNKNKDRAKTVKDEEDSTQAVSTCLTKLGVEKLHLPEESSLCSVVVSCLKNQPRVVVEKLAAASVGSHRRGGKPSHDHQQEERWKSPDSPGLDDKE